MELRKKKCLLQSLYRLQVRAFTTGAGYSKVFVAHGGIVPGWRNGDGVGAGFLLVVHCYF